jgi:hypothetical protein
MTEEQLSELRRILAEQTEKNLASREAARQFLIKSGTYTPDGQLAPQFGGPGFNEYFKPTS